MIDNDSNDVRKQALFEGAAAGASADSKPGQRTIKHIYIYIYMYYASQQMENNNKTNTNKTTMKQIKTSQQMENTAAGPDGAR